MSQYYRFSGEGFGMYILKMLERHGIPINNPELQGKIGQLIGEMYATGGFAGAMVNSPLAQAINAGASGTARGQGAAQQQAHAGGAFSPGPPAQHQPNTGMIAHAPQQVPVYAPTYAPGRTAPTPPANAPAPRFAPRNADAPVSLTDTQKVPMPTFDD